VARGGVRLSQEQVDAALARMGKPKSATLPHGWRTEGQSKMRNSIEEADGIRFPSKKHRAYFLRLKAEQHAGMIRYFIREVPFDIPGVYEDSRGRRRVARHFVDFGVCCMDGSFRWVEVKGRDIAMGRLKRIQTESLYGIKIEVV
jgi:hypothetical protein